MYEQGYLIFMREDAVYDKNVLSWKIYTKFELQIGIGRRNTEQLLDRKNIVLYNELRRKRMG